MQLTSSPGTVNMPVATGQLASPSIVEVVMMVVVVVLAISLSIVVVVLKMAVMVVVVVVVIVGVIVIDGVVVDVGVTVVVGVVVTVEVTVVVGIRVIVEINVIVEEMIAVAFTAIVVVTAVGKGTVTVGFTVAIVDVVTVRVTVIVVGAMTPAQAVPTTPLTKDGQRRKGLYGVRSDLTGPICAVVAGVAPGGPFAVMLVVEEEGLFGVAIGAEDLVVVTFRKIGLKLEMGGKARLLRPDVIATVRQSEHSIPGLVIRYDQRTIGYVR